MPKVFLFESWTVRRRGDVAMNKRDATRLLCDTGLSLAREADKELCIKGV